MISSFPRVQKGGWHYCRHCKKKVECWAPIQELRAMRWFKIVVKVWWDAEIKLTQARIKLQQAGIKLMLAGSKQAHAWSKPRQARSKPGQVINYKIFKIKFIYFFTQLQCRYSNGCQISSSYQLSYTVLL